MNFKDGVNKLRSDLRVSIEKQLVDFYKEHGIMPCSVDIKFVESTTYASQNREWKLGQVDVGFKL